MDDNKMYPDHTRPKETTMQPILFATEVPTAHLDEIHPLIDWHFVIATECLKDPEYYAWYENRPAGARIMLDNGMFEEGKPLEPHKLFKIAEKLNPDVVFAPDVVGDRYETLEMTDKFLEMCYAHEVPWKIGVIPQGKDTRELAQCYLEMLKSFDFTGPIGISFLNDRPAFIEYMNNHMLWAEDRWHHFLGMYNLDEIPTWPIWVRSMDTIKPFKAAMHGYQLSECPRGLGKWNTRIEMPHHNKELMHINYQRMKNALRR